MVVVMMKKLDGFLVPIDEEGVAAIGKLERGVIVKANITAPRNIQQHRLYFALLKLVCENMGEPMTVDALKEYLKIKLHHVQLIGFKGEVVMSPKSIDFASMDQTKFRDYFDRSLNYICTEIIPGLSETKVRAELGAMLGINYEAA